MRARYFSPVAAAVVIAGASFFGTASAANAVTTEIPVTLTDSDPVFPGFADCKKDAAVGDYAYVLQTLTVSETDTYDYVDLRPPGGDLVDICVGIYAPSNFDPSAPNSNAVAIMDDIDSVSLSAGVTYTVVTTTYELLTLPVNGLWSLDGTGIVTIGSPAAASADPPEIWFQSYARASADEACFEGYVASYASWPNDGTGGWVCDRAVKKYS